MTRQSAPKGSKAAGRRLWASVLDGFELDEHELTLLRQAVRVADTCDQLQMLVDTEGHVVGVGDRARAHPAVVELRQQRIVLARLIVALRVPLGEDEQPKQGAPRLQRRPLRGVYGGAA